MATKRFSKTAEYGRMRAFEEFDSAIEEWLQAAARLLELAKSAPAGPYTLDASDGPWAREAFVRAPSWGVVARTGIDPSLPHWDGPQRAAADLFAACDPATITTICAALQEACEERDALRADAAETALALEDLIAVGSGRLQHDFVSLCPDHMTGHDSRDNDCMACKALMRAQALIDAARQQGGAHHHG